MKLALVGATGLVGSAMLRVLEERKFPITEILPVASARSVGKTIEFQGKPCPVLSMESALAQKPDLALFSAGGTTSKEWAPKFAEQGCVVIDNSSAWRMEKKLIVPEINGHLLAAEDRIIANPNCSTIQLVMVLAPLHEVYGIKRVVVSTYQSISGTGKSAVDQMENERNGLDGEMAYPYPIDKNVLPHCDVFEESGYTKEEMKLYNETRKIMDADIALTATAVRVPVEGGHSEAVNIEFEKTPDLAEVRKLLSEKDGITVQDNPDLNIYPMPKYAQGKDEVFVGRIRKDESQTNSLNLWIVSDNLRKGAATNAVQIAEQMVEMGLLNVQQNNRSLSE